MLADKFETGALGVVWLKRLWSYWRNGASDQNAEPAETWRASHVIMSALGLGQEPTLSYMFLTRPSFEEFENWIIANNGAPFDPRQIARVNAALTGAPPPAEAARWLAELEAAPPVLDAEDLDHWDRHGWVLLKNAITTQAAENSAQVVWQAQGMNPDQPQDWGRFGPRQQCVFVQMFRHPVLDANRRSARIHKAYAQLWGHGDLWASTDRIGFNAPISKSFPFPGPGIHWDVSLIQPIPLGIQGLIYLTDTQADQGAFALVPGMHRSIASWLDSVPAGISPRDHAAKTLTMTPIAGKAGDMVLWHHALAHGPTPNTAQQPRLVQYLTMFPADFGYIPEWL